MYEFLACTIKVHRENTVLNVAHNKLITEWTLGNAELLSIKDISLRSKIPKEMKKAIDYSVPESLLNDLTNVKLPHNYNGDGIRVPKPNLNELPNKSLPMANKLVNGVLKNIKVE